MFLFRFETSLNLQQKGRKLNVLGFYRIQTAMQLQLILMGKTSIPWVQSGLVDYEKRIKRYTNFNILVVPDLKQVSKFPEDIRRKKEGERLLALLNDSFVVLLDDKGKEFTSQGFAQQLNAWFHLSYKQINLVVGGAYGFSDELYQRANLLLSLSPMTFSHQLVRTIFLEQLYRALSILNGDPYHHE